MKPLRTLTASALLVLFFAGWTGAQEPLEVPLWPQGAPGSDGWTVPETMTGADTGNRYDGVSGGFGMNRRGLPVDTWTDRFHDWLVARRLTIP